MPDIYAAITFYLRHRAEVEAYLEEGRQEAEAIRQQCQSLSDVQGIRERLLARLFAQRL